MELSASELGPLGTPGDGDLLLNVTVNVQGFAGADQAWIVEREWAEFLSQLRQLDDERRGSAVLHGVMDDELHIEFFATDYAGHMAVRGHMRRPRLDGFRLGVEFGFVDGILAGVADFEGSPHVFVLERLAALSID